MENANKNKTRFRSFLRGCFTKNIFLKVISVIFAMLLWGYLLMDQNPVRGKVLQGVDVNIEGEADLIARRLVVLGNKADILQDVAVSVNTELTKYASLSADDITASVDLKNVDGVGTYALPITAYTSEGTTTKVTPSTLNFEIDSLVSRRIPIEASIEGALPDGYWNGSVNLGRSELDIEGAKSEITRIVKAVCKIDLSTRTESIMESMTVTLLDENGEEVVPTSLLGQLPSVSVRMEILKTKTVPLNIDAAIVGRDSLADNFEITNISGSVTAARIAGLASAVDGITSLDVEQVDVTGMNESLFADTSIILPDGVKLLDDASLHVYADIKEKTDAATFTAIPIEVRGLSRKLDCTLDVDAADIVLTGRVTLIRLLEREDVKLYIDVTDMQPGQYDMHVIVDMPTDELTMELEKTLSVSVVHATITQQ